MKLDIFFFMEIITLFYILLNIKEYKRKLKIMIQKIKMEK